MCPATIVVATRRAIQKLEITKMELEHNHVSTETFKSYPEVWRLTAEERNYVQPLLELNMLPSMVVESLNERTGKLLLYSCINL